MEISHDGGGRDFSVISSIRHLSHVGESYPHDLTISQGPLLLMSLLLGFRIQAIAITFQVQSCVSVMGTQKVKIHQPNDQPGNSVRQSSHQTIFSKQQDPCDGMNY